MQAQAPRRRNRPLITCGRAARSRRRFPYSPLASGGVVAAAGRSLKTLAEVSLEHSGERHLWIVCCAFRNHSVGLYGITLSFCVTAVAQAHSLKGDWCNFYSAFISRQSRHGFDLVAVHRGEHRRLAHGGRAAQRLLEQHQPQVGPPSAVARSPDAVPCPRRLFSMLLACPFHSAAFIPPCRYLSADLLLHLLIS